MVFYVSGSQNPVDSFSAMDPWFSTIFSCRTESAVALGKTFVEGGRQMSHLKFFKHYRVGDLLRISRGSQGQILSNLGLVKGRGGGIF